MTVTAKIYNQALFGYVPHTSVDGETWQLIAKGYTNSAGAADGTTLIDSSSPSGGADTYNGRYWVHLLGGSYRDQWKRIIDDNGSGTLTFENNGFPGQVTSGVAYEIWKSPEPVVVVDSSGGETDCVDAYRTEADTATADFWDGYYLVPITGNRRGKVAEITAFTPGTGTFVLATGLGGALAAGDVCLLRKWVEVSNVSLPKVHDYIKRPMNRVNFAVGDGLLGARSGEVSFTTWVYGSGTLAGADTPANASVLSGLFGAAGLEEAIGKTAQIGAGSTTTAVKVVTGKWENLTIGQLVQVNGNIRRITAQTDGGAGVDTVTVSPALPYAPASGDLLRGMRCYQKSTDGDGMYGVTIEFEVDGIRHTMTGCKGSVDLIDGPVVSLSWKFQCDHWMRDNEAAPYYASYSTSLNAVLNHERQAWLTTTGVDIEGFTATPGSVHAKRKVQGSEGINGGAGYQLADYNCGCTFNSIVSSTDDLSHDVAYGSRSEYSVLVVYGGHANAFAISIPAARLVASPHPENKDGLVGVMYNLAALDAGTATDPDSTVVKVPDFSFCLP
jgi:hypothetical protein